MTVDSGSDRIKSLVLSPDLNLDGEFVQIEAMNCGVPGPLRKRRCQALFECEKRVKELLQSRIVSRIFVLN